MFMPVEVETKERITALEQAVAEAAGLPPKGVGEMRALVLGTYVQAF